MEKNSKVATHGREFVGVVVSDKMADTVTVEWIRRKKVKKYDRFEKARTKIAAHNELDVKVGDTVRVKECRPLSKTKHFIVTELITDTKSDEVKQ